jgi:hypothetical protein
MQIGKAGELRLGRCHRAASRRDGSDRARRQTGAILPAEHFSMKGRGAVSKLSIMPLQHGAGRQLAESSMASRWAMPPALAMAVSFFHQAKIVVAAAQVDDGADAPALSESRQARRPGLHRARRFTRDHPVEVVEDVADCSAAGPIA